MLPCVVAAAEKELERSIRNEDLLRLMKLQKTLVYFNTSIRGNEVMVGKLQSIFQEKDYQNRDLVEDVVIELKQAYNTVNIYSDILLFWRPSHCLRWPLLFSGR